MSYFDRIQPGDHVQWSPGEWSIYLGPDDGGGFRIMEIEGGTYRTVYGLHVSPETLAALGR